MKQRTILLAGSTAPIAKDPRYSHYSGPALILAHQLRSLGHKVQIVTGSWLKPEDWLASATDVILYHGLDMNGKLSINLYGGGTAENWAKMINMCSFASPFSKNVNSAFYPMPNYAEYAQARRWNPEPKNFLQGIASLATLNGSEICNNPIKSGHLILGDSHAPSIWVPGAHLEVHSGMTMHGALTIGIGELIKRAEDKNQAEYAKLTLYFGNIDIRHHICRVASNTKAQIDEVHHLLEELGRQLMRLPEDVQEIEVVEPLFIEPETRVIPKTGWYKGQPFHGRWFDRNIVRTAWKMKLQEICAHLDLELYAHPKEWSIEDVMNEEFMERPRSVHIAPIHYRAAKELFA